MKDYASWLQTLSKILQDRLADFGRELSFSWSVTKQK